MRTNAARLLDEAKALVRRHGWEVREEVRADTGSLYFSAHAPDRTGQDHPNSDNPDTDKDGGSCCQETVFLRVRISDHRPAGWQARARFAFISNRCMTRAKRDLERLERRIVALSQGDARGRATRALKRTFSD